MLMKSVETDAFLVELRRIQSTEVVLGVGKTSLIQQFLESHFTRDHKATQLTTNNENCFTFTMILNGTLYEVRILDMPLINYFPSNTLYEWTDYRGYALRRANGYLLVFDLTSPGQSNE
ncbi:ras-like protein family member 10B [Leptotrombidium deliense]|uniref:Ras-like protein family member 10B n=1 Tax=Leptotrombidium deliense TaxID=299467 RepID=A0A443RXC2_9ACAR|nr:ras-like protein family member 10B [Leptotrombidium deliense]